MTGKNESPICGQWCNYLSLPQVEISLKAMSKHFPFLACMVRPHVKACLMHDFHVDSNNSTPFYLPQKVSSGVQMSENNYCIIWIIPNLLQFTK